MTDLLRNNEFSVMQTNRTGFVLNMMFLSSILLGGCTTTYLDMKSWEGRTINDLYFEWGKADKVEYKGNFRVHSWLFERSVDGKSKTCTKSFYARYDGHEEIIVDTKYSDCLFLIAN